MKKKHKTILDRVRAVESALRDVHQILPYLRDCILVTKILMEKGIITREDITTAYDKLKNV